jgi:hypothetical protein
MIFVDFRPISNDDPLYLFFCNFAAASLGPHPSSTSVADLEALKNSGQLPMLCLQSLLESHDVPSQRMLCCLLLKNYCAELEKYLDDVVYSPVFIQKLLHLYNGVIRNDILLDAIIIIFRGVSFKDVEPFLIPPFISDCSGPNLPSLVVSSSLVLAFVKKFEIRHASDQLFLEILSVANSLLQPLKRLFSTSSDPDTVSDSHLWTNLIDILYYLFYHDIPEVFLGSLEGIFSTIERIADHLFAQDGISSNPLAKSFLQLLHLMLTKYHEDVPNLGTFAGYLVRVLTSSVIHDLEDGHISDYLLLLNQIFSRDDVVLHEYDIKAFINNVLCPILLPTEAEIELAEENPCQYIKSLFDTDNLSRSEAVSRIFLTLSKSNNFPEQFARDLLDSFDISSQPSKIAVTRLVTALAKDQIISVESSYKIVIDFVSFPDVESFLAVHSIVFFVRLYDQVF